LKVENFPDVSEANGDGLLAIGGDLSEERLLLAYHSGIFPWFSKGDPILWWSPDPRFVLFPDKLRVSKSMKKLIRDKEFQVTFNQNFESVIENCATIKREGQADTWITEEMKEAYINLHKQGYAKSVEVWRHGLSNSPKLVGGLYGIDLGNVFCGESMFSAEANASKFGFIKWVQHLQNKKYDLIDCQVHTPHLESLGAEMISRERFLNYLSV
jgi:leucyl/phenylalanyl-tRNA--protein transferase